MKMEYVEAVDGLNIEAVSYIYRVTERRNKLTLRKGRQAGVFKNVQKGRGGAEKLPISALCLFWSYLTFWENGEVNLQERVMQACGEGKSLSVS